MSTIDYTNPLKIIVDDATGLLVLIDATGKQLAHAESRAGLMSLAKSQGVNFGDLASLPAGSEQLELKYAVVSRTQMFPVDSSGKIAIEETKAKVEYAALTDPAKEPYTLLDIHDEGPGEEGRERQARSNIYQITTQSGDPLVVPPHSNLIPGLVVDDIHAFRQPAAGAARPGDVNSSDFTGYFFGDVSLRAKDDASGGAKPPGTYTFPQVKYVVDPQENILDQYASYNYNIGWYLLNASVLRKPRLGNTPYNFRAEFLKGYFLLAQSGGGGVRDTERSQSVLNTNNVQDLTQLASRNPYFNLDYYIDSLEIETLFPGGATKQSNTHANIKFTLHEPNGITLTKNLFSAVQAVYGSQSLTKTTFLAGKVGLASAYYALVIRFYGYDENGKIVAARNKNTTDSQAVVEKFIPFQLATINFRIANRVTEYVIEGVPVPYTIAGSFARGTIQNPISLTGSTVEDILVGKSVGTLYPESDGRSQAPYGRDIHDEGSLPGERPVGPTDSRGVTW